MTRPQGREPSDQAVRDMVRSRVGDSMLLEAGAGTGKTTVLVQRVSELLKTEGRSLDRIAIITFTEKAAGELKVRVREQIEKDIEKSRNVSPGWEAVLRQSLSMIDRAPIQTIHAFAAQLLRERPVEAEIDPRFSVADELSASMLMGEAWERWLESQMTEGAGPLRDALECGITPLQLRGLAFSLADERDAGLASGESGAGLPEFRDRLDRAIGDLAARAGSCRDETDLALAEVRRLEALKGEPPAGSLGSFLERLRDLGGRRQCGKAGNWVPAADLALVREGLEGIRALRDEAARCLAARIGTWLRDGFLGAWREAKESRRLLDFSDLLILCRNLLRDSQPARAWYQQRYQALLVDEFQDTDPLQAEILFLLASDDPEQSDWRRCTPRQGSLFVVGDPKQSIYRFRRADIQTYEEVRGRLPGSLDGTALRLAENFRTVPSIVAWVNDLFERLIQPVPLEGAQPKYEAIAPWRSEPDLPAAGPGASPRVRLLLPGDAAHLAGENAEGVRRAEARHVVALLRTAVEEEWPVVGGKEEDGTRPIGWDDMALLFRTGTAFSIYEEILREAGLPYRISGGRRYYLRSETRALQAVLAAVESPHDPLAVVSALRCPVFGHSDEELIGHAASGGDWVFTRGGAGPGSPLERTFELLQRLHRERQSRSIAATMEDLLESTGFLSLCYVRPDGEQRAANVLKAIDLARAHAAAGGGSFGSFVRWFESMSSDGRHEGEAPIVEEAESERAAGASQAIRILTIHKAKGLEFPLVVLCDASGATRAPGATCIVERDGADPGGRPRLHFRIGPAEHGLRSEGYDAAADREKVRLDAERARLFYVAATRARDYLVVPAFTGRQAGWIHAWLSDEGFLPPAGEGLDGQSVRGARCLHGSRLKMDSPPAAAFRFPVGEARPADPALTLEKEGWRRALRAALAAPTMGRAYRTASGLELKPEPYAGGAATIAALEARGVGIAVHGVLERIDLATRRDLGILAEEEADAAGVPGRAAEIRSLVERALEAPIVREALTAPRLFREMHFAAAGEAWLTEGRIDLAFEEGGMLTIVDFKTDAIASEQEARQRTEAYRPQALVYARALGEVSGLAVRRVVFHFIRPGLATEVPIDDAALAAGRRLLETGDAHPPAS